MIRERQKMVWTSAISAARLQLKSIIVCLWFFPERSSAMVFGATGGDVQFSVKARELSIRQIRKFMATQLDAIAGGGL
jgi:hypothetical protein